MSLDTACSWLCNPVTGKVSFDTVEKRIICKIKDFLNTSNHKIFLGSSMPLYNKLAHLEQIFKLEVKGSCFFPASIEIAANDAAFCSYCCLIAVKENR